MFFGLLTRRAAYTKKRNGSCYSYSTYRERYHYEIAEDCLKKCVYCDVHEDEIGGREAMEIDHFRPKSRKEFAHLVNEPLNFHHSCSRCNQLKGDFWIAEDPQLTHNDVAGFIDPFSVDRLDYFSVKKDGELEPIKPPALYMITLLELNRPYLKKIREDRVVLRELEEQVNEIRESTENEKVLSLLDAVDGFLQRFKKF